MAGITLNDFRSNIGELARSNRFQVSFSGAGSSSGFTFDENEKYQCKTAVLPARTIGQIELDWFGEKAKIGGDPTYEDLTLGFWNPETMQLRQKFERWMNAISDTKANTRPDVPAAYKAIITIEQYGSGANALQNVYQYDGCWPNNVAEISLDMSSTDSAQEFDVTFSVDLSGHITAGTQPV